MNAVRIGRIVGCKIESNSMCEKDLSSPVNSKLLVSTPKGIRIQQNSICEVPRIIGADIDITKDSLYQYLLE